MAGFSFWEFRMPNANNLVQGAKHHIDRDDAERAERALDAFDKNLEEARAETLDAIRKRDSGDSRDDDPDVRAGRRW